MAQGMSTLAILHALAKKGRGKQTAIGPYQCRAVDYYDPSLGPSEAGGWEGIGLAMVERAGLTHMLQWIEEPDYLALPRLLERGERYDLIFIDGYHTFDYVFLDYFYSDLLLNEGGFLVFDDVLLPMVHKVCWFVETHKAYRRLGPSMTHPLNTAYRAFMAAQRLLGLRGPRNADREWGSIMAYQKIRSTKVRPLYFHTAFYPYFRGWWLLKRFRGILGAARRGAKLPTKPPPFEP
jgi:hypothetical protein